MTVMLMLSGGKDSCSLAYHLFDLYGEHQLIFFTNDPGFLSKVAIDNINKVRQDLPCEFILHDAGKEQQKVVEKYFVDKKQKMMDVCGWCTQISQLNACQYAQDKEARIIFTGNTKNNGSIKSHTSVNFHGQTIRFSHPYVDNYNYAVVTKVCADHTINPNPMETNCLFLRSILRIHYHRWRYNPYREEIEELYSAGHINMKYKQALEHFCTGRPQHDRGLL